MRYAQYRIWIGLIWPIPDPAENASIGADIEYRIDASLLKTSIYPVKTILKSDF